MKEDNKSEVSSLREKAEDLLKMKSIATASFLSQAEMLKLIFELEVHQIELNIQNEELEFLNEKASDEAEKYTNLFDFAPSGYFILSKEGEIIDTNQSGRKMIGKECQSLKNSKFGFFVSDDTKKIFNLFLKTIFKSKDKQSCELTLITDYTLQKCVYLSGQIIKNSEQCYLSMIDITYLKKAEIKLEETEERLEILYNNAPLSYQSLDSDGNIIEVNEKWLATLGYTQIEVIGKWFGNFLSPAYKDDFQKRFPIFKANGAIQSEFEMVHKNGNKLFIAFEGRIGYDLNGEFKQSHCILQDITDRNKAVQELALRNSGLLTLNRIAIELSNLPSDVNLEAFITERVKAIACAEVAIYSVYDYANRTLTTKHIEMESILLEKVGAILGKKIQDMHFVVSEEDYRTITTEMIGIRKNLFEVSFGAIPRKLGTAIQALLNVDRVIGIAYIIEGKLYGTSILLIGKDQPDPPSGILENFMHLAASSLRRKQSVEMLQQSEAKFRNLYDTAIEGIFQTSLEGKIMQSNKALAKMLGYASPSDAVTLVVDSENQVWVNADERHQYTSQFEKQDVVQGFECQFKRTDDIVIWVSLNARLVRDENGKKLYYEGFIEDITNRKKTESELIRAKEKAEECDRLKSAFLANMSHEIRTPMNGILGFTQLLTEPNLTREEQQDFIRTIEKSGERMLNTLNDIIDFSKIESGLTKLVFKALNINEQIEFVYKFFKQEVESKGLKFSFKNCSQLNDLIVETDHEKIGTILINLVKNAIKFTYEGSIEFGYVKKGKYLEFFVKDTGIGIPLKLQQTIFERFRQGSESYDRMYEGSGLGLSISKSYIEMLGGEIWLKSEERKGTIFYFTIPCDIVSDGKKAIGNDVSENVRDVQIKKLKILIAEDDPISYSLLTRILQKISKEFLYAKTGIEAVIACHNNPDLDLVLMDIKMPDMDGCEATRQIRLFNSDVIIIAQTAFVLSDDREKAIEAGCNDYISKPINKSYLYKLISRHVNK